MRPLRILIAPAALFLAPAAALAQSSPSAFTSATRYDAAGRVTGTISPDPDTVGSGNPFLAVRNSYDGAGRLTKVETGTLSSWQSESVAPSAWGTAFTVYRTLETQYDAVGHKLRDSLRESATGPIRTITQYSYDSVGRLECTAVRMNPAVFGSLPSSACTLGTEGSDGPDRISRTVYDAAGERLQAREGVGTGAEAAEATWAYNDNGQIVTVLDGNGNRADLHYDGFGRQDRWTFPSATMPSAYNDATQASALASAGSVNTSDHEDYSYDAGGNRTELRKRDGRRIQYAYDNLGRVTAKTYPDGGATAVYYAYDNRNLQLYARYSSTSGQGATNAYDGFGNLVSASTDLGGTTRTLTYQYDRDGARTRITHPDSNWFGYAWDGIGRPSALTAPGATMATWTWYDHGGVHVVSRANGSANELWYDAVQRPSMNQLNVAGSAYDAAWTYGYNPAGQLGSESRDNNAYAWGGHYAVNRAYTRNGLNQYTAAGSASFTYDANGNLTSDGATTYGYDIENRLVTATGAHAASLAYDPLGRLWQISVGGSVTTTFLYDGDALAAEYDGAGAMTRRYAHGVGADVPLLSYAGSGLSSPYYLHPDRQGSIVAVSDPSGNGAVNSYDEYGIPGAGNTGRFQYTGQVWLAELGLYYYKARIYSPTLGRMMQTDPVGYADQFNLYAYVGDDPVNRVDATGQFTLQAGSAHDAPRLLQMVNRLSNTQYSLNANREFVPTAATNPAGSRAYSDDINVIINSPSVNVMHIAPTVTEQLNGGVSAVHNVDTEYGGGVTYLASQPGAPGATNIVVVSGNGANDAPGFNTGGAPLNQSPEEVLMHELVVEVIGGLTAGSPSIGRENRVRMELGLPERANDPHHSP